MLLVFIIIIRISIAIDSMHCERVTMHTKINTEVISKSTNQWYNFLRKCRQIWAILTEGVYGKKIKIFNVLVTLVGDGATSLDASVMITAYRFECLLQVIKHLSRKFEIAVISFTYCQNA